jgi:hypothetical protein
MFPVIALLSLAYRAFCSLSDTGGFSIDANGSPQCGFMVSIPHCEVIHATPPSVSSLLNYFADNTLGVSEYYGGWQDNGKTYLDISVNVSDRRAALYLARDNRQIAIYDVENAESAYLADELRIYPIVVGDSLFSQVYDVEAWKDHTTVRLPNGNRIQVDVDFAPPSYLPADVQSALCRVSDCMYS